MCLAYLAVEPSGLWPLSACLLAGIGNIVLVMNAIETTGIVDAQRQLRLDEPLPIAGQSRVRVIVLVPDEADISESAWAKAAATSPAFDFLKDAAEDVYTATDGKPFHDQVPRQGGADTKEALGALAVVLTIKALKLPHQV